MAETERGFPTPEEEIKELERRLEEKKRALTESGAELPHEKEVFRDVLKEHISDVRSVGGEVVVPVTPPVSTSRDDDVKKMKEDLKEDVRMLVEIAMTKSIGEAIRVAQRAGSPYLLDELHDHLVDDYYDKLVSLRKI